jgi:Cu-processing system ATP-binding protein
MIRYQGFTKRFGSLLAVRELNLEIGAGETVAVIGPNGSGKTTTLKAALGLVRPSAGSVQVAGFDALREGRSARARLGYLPQRLTFPEGCTALEAMALYARIRGADQREIARHLERVGLAGAADRPAETYSGGMRQRLGLAIALLGAPTALILDEPTAALDPSGSLMVRDLVESIREEGTTVVISSHDLAEVSVLADRIAIFVDGRLAANGSASELVRSLGLLTKLRVALPVEGEGVMAGRGNALAAEAGTAGPSALAAAIVRAGGRRIRWGDGALHCEAEPSREAAVLEAVRQAGVAATEIRVRSPGLEEVYRAVTGPAAEDGSEDRSPGPSGQGPAVEWVARRPARVRGVVTGGGAR